MSVVHLGKVREIDMVCIDSLPVVILNYIIKQGLILL